MEFSLWGGKMKSWGLIWFLLLNTIISMIDLKAKTNVKNLILTFFYKYIYF